MISDGLWSCCPKVNIGKKPMNKQIENLIERDFVGWGLIKK
jgi:hypothetical protein